MESVRRSVSKSVCRVFALIPGPMPTPVLSPEVMLAKGSLDRMVGEWAEGDMGAGGGAMLSAGRREDVDDVWRGLYGEGGRELRSGAMVPRIRDMREYVYPFMEVKGP